MGKEGKQWQTIFFGSKITVDGDWSHEIKRHLLLGRKPMTKLMPSELVMPSNHHHHKTQDWEPRDRAVLLASLILLLSAGAPFPKKSLALSARVSPQTLHSRVLDKSPVSGPGRGPPSCNRFTEEGLRERRAEKAWTCHWTGMVDKGEGKQGQRSERKTFLYLAIQYTVVT